MNNLKIRQAIARHRLRYYEVAKELGISREEVKKSFMVKYQKSEQETEELMKIYWK